MYLALRVSNHWRGFGCVSWYNLSDHQFTRDKYSIGQELTTKVYTFEREATPPRNRKKSNYSWILFWSCKNMHRHTKSEKKNINFKTELIDIKFHYKRYNILHE